MPEDIALDKTTGMPVLPEGYFFKVKREKYHKYGPQCPPYQVSVHRKRFLRSRLIVFTEIAMDESKRDEITRWGGAEDPVDSLVYLTGERILATALYLYPRLLERIENQKLALEHTGLLGKYPPNSIGK